MKWPFRKSPVKNKILNEYHNFINWIIDGAHNIDRDFWLPLLFLFFAIFLFACVVVFAVSVTPWYWVGLPFCLILLLYSLYKLDN